MSVRVSGNDSDMLCDNCRQNNYARVGIHSNVKSTVHYMVMCFSCNYRTVKKLSTKRNL